jgi:preprotein translocase subunit SecB
MQIQFNHIQFTELDYKVKTFDKSITHELDTSLTFGSSFPEDDTKKFAIIFDFSLQSKSKKFKLKLKAVAHFSTQENINDDFKNSPFININAPAIAFPYVRSFISNLTLNSGYDPIVLPALNFVKLAEKEK